MPPVATQEKLEVFDAPPSALTNLLPPGSYDSTLKPPPAIGEVVTAEKAGLKPAPAIGQTVQAPLKPAPAIGQTVTALRKPPAIGEVVPASPLPTAPPRAATGGDEGPSWRKSRWAAEIERETSARGLDPDLFYRLIRQESGEDPNVVSVKGARGVTQLMPGTAAELGVNPDDPAQNIAGGAEYLYRALKRRNGDTKLALMDYNWGPGNVDKWLLSGADPSQIPPETQKYTAKILGADLPMTGQTSIFPIKAEPEKEEPYLPEVGGSRSQAIREELRRSKTMTQVEEEGVGAPVGPWPGTVEAPVVQPTPQFPQGSEQPPTRRDAAAPLQNPFLEGAIQGSMGVSSAAARVMSVLQPTSFRELNQGADAMIDTRRRREEEAVKYDERERVIPAWLAEAARGATSSLVTSAAGGMTAGIPGAIGMASLQEGSDAVKEAKDAGLTGHEAARYVAGKATIEALPASVFSAMGWGGFEQVFGKGGMSVAGQGFKDAFRQLGIRTLQEVPEEIITEIGHRVAEVPIRGPEAVTAESLYDTVKKTVAQTLMMTAMGGSPSLAAGATESASNALSGTQTPPAPEKGSDASLRAFLEANNWRDPAKSNQAPVVERMSVPNRGMRRLVGTNPAGTRMIDMTRRDVRPRQAMETLAGDETVLGPNPLEDNTELAPVPPAPAPDARFPQMPPGVQRGAVTPSPTPSRKPSQKAEPVKEPWEMTRAEWGAVDPELLDDYKALEKKYLDEAHTAIGLPNEAAAKKKAMRIWKMRHGKDPRARYWSERTGGDMMGSSLQEDAVTNAHRSEILNAIALGKTIRPDILAEYPDLMPAAPKARAGDQLPPPPSMEEFQRMEAEREAKRQGLKPAPAIGEVVTTEPQTQFADAKLGHSMPEAQRKEFRIYLESERVKGQDVDPNIVDEADLIENAETGKPIRVQVYRGEGRTDQGSIYGTANKEPILGPGRYGALGQSVAKNYGPNVTPYTAELSNPLIIEDTSTIPAALMPGSGASVEQKSAAIKAWRADIEAQGHDGVIVNLPAWGDVDSKNRSVKRLRELFGHTQVIEFNPKKETQNEGQMQGQRRQEEVAPPAKAPSAPIPTTFEEFEKEYRKAFANAAKYTPDQAGFHIHTERMAELADARPDWAEQVENKKETAPTAGAPAPADPIDKVFASMDGGKFETSIYENWDELPQPIKDQRKHMGITHQFVATHRDGEIIIIRDGLRALAKKEGVSIETMAASVWVHERGIHGGLRHLLSPAERTQILTAVIEKIEYEGGVDEVISRIPALKGYDKRVRTGILSKEIFAEEYLAFLATELEKKGKLNPKDQAVWEKFVQFVKKVLGNISALGVVSKEFDVSKIDPEYIARSIAIAMKQEAQGKPKEAPKEKKPSKPRPKTSKPKQDYPPIVRRQDGGAFATRQAAVLTAKTYGIESTHTPHKMENGEWVLAKYELDENLDDWQSDLRSAGLSTQGIRGFDDANIFKSTAKKQSSTSLEDLGFPDGEKSFPSWLKLNRSPGGGITWDQALERAKELGIISEREIEGNGAALIGELARRDPKKVMLERDAPFNMTPEEQLDELKDQENDEHTEGSLKMADLVFMNGEWFRVEDKVDEGTILVDGKRELISHYERFGAHTILSKGHYLYEEALKEFHQQEAGRKEKEKDAVSKLSKEAQEVVAAYGTRQKALDALTNQRKSIIQHMDRIPLSLEDKAEKMREETERVDRLIKELALGISADQKPTKKNQGDMFAEPEDEGEVEDDDEGDTLFFTGGLTDRMQLDTTTDKRVSAMDVRKFIENTWDIPIRSFGTHRKGNRLGFYKPYEHLIRDFNFKDIEVLAHEFAHALERIIWTTRAAANQAWKPYKKELQDLDYDQNQRRPYEGFAEFMRYWLMGEDTTKMAPGFTKFWNDTVLKGPHRANLMKLKDEYYPTFIEEGAVGRFGSQIDITRGAKNRKLPMFSRLGRAYSKLRTWMLTDIDVLERSMKAGKLTGKMDPDIDPVQVATAIRGKASSTAESYIFDKARTLGGKVVGPGLKEILKPVAKDMHNFTLFITALRAKNLQRRGIESGFFQRDIDYIIRKFDSPAFRKAAKEVTEWSAHLLDLLVESGALDQKSAKLMKKLNPIYVPFYRVFVDEVSPNEGGRGKSGAGVADQGVGVKRMHGSQRAIDDPFAAFMTYTENLINAANKARLARAIVAMGQQGRGLGKYVSSMPAQQAALRIPTQRIIDALVEAGAVDPADLDMDMLDRIMTFYMNAELYKGPENIVTLMVDGERKFFELHPDLYRIAKDLDKVALNPFLDFFLGKPARLVRLGATQVKPSFALANFMRDTFGFAMNAEYSHLGPLGPLRGLYLEMQNIFGKGNEVVKLFNFAGGRMSGQIGADRKVLLAMHERLIAEASGSRKKQAMVVLKHPVEALRAAISIFESAARLAEFEAALKFGNKKYGKDSEAALILALNAAQDVTINFTRGGSIGRVINGVIAFFNASLQDPSKVYRTFKAHPFRTTARGIAYLTVPSMLLWLHNRDEDWYKELASWEKAAFWHFEMGGSIYRLPKPFLYGLLFASIPEAILDSLYQEDPELTEDIVASSLRTMMPGLPSAGAPLFHIATNKDFAGRPIVPGRLQGLPDEQQFTEYTPEIYKIVGGVLGISPLRLEYGANAYTGGFTGSVIRSTEALGKMATGQETNPADRPLVGRFIRRDADTPHRSEERFYRRIDALRKKKKGDTITKDEAIDLMAMEEVYRAVSEINAALRKADAAKDVVSKDILERLKDILVRSKTKGLRAALGAPPL